MFPSKSCNNCILFPVGNLNVELMKTVHMGEGVGSSQTFCRQLRVGSTFRRVGSKKSDPWTTLCYQPIGDRSWQHLCFAPHYIPILCLQYFLVTLLLILQFIVIIHAARSNSYFLCSHLHNEETNQSVRSQTLELYWLWDYWKVKKLAFV